MRNIRKPGTAVEAEAAERSRFRVSAPRPWSRSAAVAVDGADDREEARFHTGGCVVDVLRPKGAEPRAGSSVTGHSHLGPVAPQYVPVGASLKGACPQVRLRRDPSRLQFPCHLGKSTDRPNEGPDGGLPPSGSRRRWAYECHERLRRGGVDLVVTPTKPREGRVLRGPPLGAISPYGEGWCVTCRGPGAAPQERRSAAASPGRKLASARAWLLSTVRARQGAEPRAGSQSRYPPTAARCLQATVTSLQR